MDPYLERSGIWRSVHHDLITAVQYALVPHVAPRYYIAVEERAYILDVGQGERTRSPDLAVATVTPTEEAPSRSGGTATLVAPGVQRVVLPLYEERREAYLEIREVETHVVVTAIEVLSPTNKAPGDGRKEYEVKRRQVLQTHTNLVEVDLLRGGTPMGMEPTPPSDYRILVLAGWEYPTARLHAFGLRDPIPDVLIPLRADEPEIPLPIGALLHETYERARYDLRIDYRLVPPDPPLAEADLVWLDAILREQGRRA
jgi:hypothetical protein